MMLNTQKEMLQQKPLKVKNFDRGANFFCLSRKNSL
uniref:Uncharacterized protein n=1 Tax=Rhizophora mucronata TaxID=61149 RepID=A0A2P2PN70_RHIMU